MSTATFLKLPRNFAGSTRIGSSISSLFPFAALGTVANEPLPVEFDSSFAGMILMFVCFPETGATEKKRIHSWMLESRCWWLKSLWNANLRWLSFFANFSSSSSLVSSFLLYLVSSQHHFCCPYWGNDSIFLYKNETALKWIIEFHSIQMHFTHDWAISAVYHFVTPDAFFSEKIKLKNHEQIFHRNCVMEMRL